MSRLALIVLVSLCPVTTLAQGPWADFRPQWYIDYKNALREHREKARQDDLFEDLYDRNVDELGPLLADDGPCGAGARSLWGSMAHARINKDGSITFIEHDRFDLFNSMSSSAIADWVSTVWSFDTCVRGKSRRIVWLSRKKQHLATVDESGDVKLPDEAGVIRTYQGLRFDDLVRAFPCQSADDCVFLRETCANGRQRSPFSRRSPYFDRLRAALDHEYGVCEIPEDSPFDTMRATCTEYRHCDAIIDFSRRQ